MNPPSLFLLALSLSYASAAPTLRLVRDLNRTPLDYSLWSEWMMDSDINLVFPKADVVHGVELWCSDGMRPGFLGCVAAGGLRLRGGTAR